MKISETPLVLLKKAIVIYLERAYPSQNIPLSVLDLVDFGPSRDLLALIETDKFERCYFGEPKPVADKYKLRLGREGYPHMKLSLERFRDSDEYVFVVDTHDNHMELEDVIAGERLERLRKLQTSNEAIKGEIEDEWAKAGLPTFGSYMQDWIQKRKGKINGEEKPRDQEQAADSPLPTRSGNSS